METFRTKEKIKDLYVYLNDRMKSWPQYEKYALSEYCRCKLLHMIELCVAINKSSKAKARSTSSTTACKSCATTWMLRSVRTT